MKNRINNKKINNYLFQSYKII